MKHTRIATLCLVLMILIALANFRAPAIHPIDSIARITAPVADQTGLMRVLHQAERSARGE